MLDAEDVMLSFGVLPGHTGDLLANAELAEALGYDSLWVGDHLLWHVASPDAAVLLGAIAARTSSALIGTAVYLAALRGPVAVAKMGATLDHLSGGRFILGAGIGGENPAEFAAAGVPLSQRSGRLDETLEICRALWGNRQQARGNRQQGEGHGSDGAVSYRGRYFRFEDVRFDLAPLTPGGPPIWVGGRAARSLARAGRLGDGWLAFVVTPERFAEGWAAVRGHAAAAGRDPDALTPALQVWCNLAGTDAEARSLLAPRIEAFYRVPFERFERFTICGSAETWRERIAAFAAAGVRHFNLIFDGGDPQAQMVRFATELMPLLRAE